MALASHPLRILLAAFVALVLGVVADLDDHGTLVDVAGLVAIVVALIAIAIVLPLLAARDSEDDAPARRRGGGASRR